MPRKNKSTAPAAPRPLTGLQRLNKVLAAAGLGSRRDCEQFILDGRIEVDGQPVTDLATKVDFEAVKITFDGTQLKSFRPVYFALHKPTGVLSTNSDPSGRMRAIDLVNVKERIFSVGRLDRFSEGLMLLTNDGELAQRLAHPRYGVQKLYLATVQGEVTQIDLEKLVRGVRLSEGFAKVDAVKLRKQRSGAAELEIALSEGKNREIRRILARLGHKVVALRRLAIGPLRLGQLPVGGWRPLSREEVLALYSTTTHRKKRRGPLRPLRSGGSHPEDREEPMAIGTSVGRFDQSLDDDDDDYGPPPIYGDEADFEDNVDQEAIALNDSSIVGTVIPYDEDAEDGEDEPAKPVRRKASPRADSSRSISSRGAGSSASAGSRSSGSASTARSGDRASGESTGISSVYDLRNRRPKKTPTPRASAGRSAGGSSSSSTPRSSAGPRSAGPRSAGPRSSEPRSAGPRSAGPRSAGLRSAGPRSAGPRSTGAGSRSAGAKTAAPRTGASRSASRTDGPRTARPGADGSKPSGSRTGSDRSSGPRTGAPRTGGAKPSGVRAGGARSAGSKSPARGSASRPPRSGPSTGARPTGSGTARTTKSTGPRTGTSRPTSSRASSSGSRPASGSAGGGAKGKRGGGGRPGAGRPGGGRPSAGRSGAGRSGGSGSGPRGKGK